MATYILIYLDINTGRLIVIWKVAHTTVGASKFILHVFISQTIVADPTASFSMKFKFNQGFLKSASKISVIFSTAPSIQGSAHLDLGK